MELRDAIDQISTIRIQLAATERLRSLRAVPVALSGLLALLAAIVQPLCLGDALAQPGRYVALWCSAAVLSGLAAGFVVLRRVRRCPSTLTAANAWHATVQFVPCLVAGAVVTWFVVVRLPQQLWLLPGLWQLLFGLGNLAAHRLLPAGAPFVGLLFLATGTCCLWFGERALDPWAMGMPFAAGQLALAVMLWWHNERDDGRLEIRG